MQQEKEAVKNDCPINLDKIHCQNCFFIRDGKCVYPDETQNAMDINKKLFWDNWLSAKHQPAREQLVVTLPSMKIENANWLNSYLEDLAEHLGRELT